MEDKKGEKYCVYGEQIAPYLMEIGRDTYNSIQQALAKYPGLDFTSMVHTACHRAATLATNAALRQPLDRMKTESPQEEYAPSAIERNKVITECWNAVRGEHLQNPEPGESAAESGDEIYDRAVRDCANAVMALKGVQAVVAEPDAQWCMDAFWRVNPGRNATVPSLYLLDFAREVLRVYGAARVALAPITFTPNELVHLADWHDEMAAFNDGQDYFAGAAQHKARAEELRRSMNARNAQEKT